MLSPLREVSWGTVRRRHRLEKTHHSHRDAAVTDNWVWDSVATKQLGLNNENNEAVLGCFTKERIIS